MVITINGTEDAPVIGGVNTGALTEDGVLTVSGALTITDVDTNDNPISFNDVAPTLSINGYGNFEITANTWTYTLDNAHASVQALDVGETLTDNFIFNGSDGSIQLVTVTINGAEDAPVIGGTSVGAVTEDGTLTASALLTITDLDASDNPISFIDLVPTPGVNGYGSFEIAANTWTYTLDNTHASVQALDVGETLSDNFTFTASDGSTRVVTVTINGTEDIAVIGGASTGAVTEDGPLIANAALTITDVDTSDNPVSFNDVVATAGDSGYGDFEMTASTWTYTLDNTDSAVQALDVGEILNDTFTFTATDGSVQLVTVTINGAEDAPVIGGTSTGTVVEDGTLTANGTLTITDVDTSDNPISFNDVATTAGDNGYGDFEMTGNTWTYTLDDTDSAVQALDVGESLNDTFSFIASDGSVQLVTVTINGAEDAPTLNKAISDQIVRVNSQLDFAFPANSFRDVDTSDSLTYTVTLADNSPLPGWLSFDSLTRTFSGTPNSADVGELDLKVTADDGNSTVSATFSIEVQGTLDPTIPPGVDPDPDPVPGPDPVEPPGTGEPPGPGGIDPIIGEVDTDPSGIKIVAMPQPRGLPDAELVDSGITSLLTQEPYEVDPDYFSYADRDDREPVQPLVLQIKDPSLETLGLQVSDDESLNEQYERQLLRYVDLMHQDMDGESEHHSSEVEVKVFVGASVSLTAGIVSWVLRSGSLLASLMSSVGLLNRFDLVPILKNRQDEEDVEPDDGSDVTDVTDVTDDTDVTVDMIKESDGKVDRMFSKNSGKP